MRKAKSKPKRKYELKNYCLLINGNLVRDWNDMPYRCSKKVAEANVKNKENCKMLKIGKDIIFEEK